MDKLQSHRRFSTSNYHSYYFPIAYLSNFLSSESDSERLSSSLESECGSASHLPDELDEDLAEIEQEQEEQLAEQENYQEEVTETEVLEYYEQLKEWHQHCTAVTSAAVYQSQMDAYLKMMTSSV